MKKGLLTLVLASVLLAGPNALACCLCYCWDGGISDQCVWDDDPQIKACEFITLAGIEYCRHGDNCPPISPPDDPIPM